MDLIDTAISPDSTMAWLNLLVNVAIKGTMILLLAGLATMLIRKTSASVKHIIWNLALGSILVLPVLTTVLPAWETPMLPSFLDRVSDSQQSSVNHFPPSSGKEAASGQLDEQRETKLRKKETSESLVPTENTAVPKINDLSKYSQSRQSTYSIHWSGRILMVWILGVLVLSARLLIGFFVVRRLLRRANIATQNIENLTRRLASALGLNRDVGVFLSNQITVPMTWGFFRPVILLPNNFEKWSMDQQRIAMLHELAHAKRYDTITQLLMQITCILHWFNPMAWLAIWQIHKHRERACDDHVLNAGTKPSDYADHLLQIVRSVRSSRLLLVTTVAMARRSQLEGRLLAILNPNLSRKVMNPLFGTLLIVLAIGTVMPLAAMDLWQPDKEGMALNPVDSRDDKNNVLDEQKDSGADEIEALAAGEGDASARNPLKQFRIGSDPSADEVESVSTNVPVKQRKEDSPARANEEEKEESSLQLEAEKKQDNKTIEDSLVVKALAQALQDEDWEVRKQAAWALGEMKDPGIVTFLTKALLSEPNWQVREQIANSLGNAEDDRAVSALASVVTNDENWRVRMEAAEALGDIASPKAIDALSKASSDANREVRREAVWALGEIHDTRAVEALILSLKDIDWEIRRRAASSLGDIESHESVEALILSLKDEHPEVRVEAVEALSQINDYRAVEPLVAVLNDEFWEVREKAIEALGEMANSRSLEPLMNVLTNDSNRDVRAQAAYTLGKIGDRRAVDILIKAMSDEHWEVREHAAHALGDIRDAAATAALTRALKDDNREVRSTAAWALGELR